MEAIGGGRRGAQSPCILLVIPDVARAQNRPDALTSHGPNLVYKSQADVKPYGRHPASHAPITGQDNKGRDGAMQPTRALLGRGFRAGPGDDHVHPAGGDQPGDRADLGRPAPEQGADRHGAGRLWPVLRAVRNSHGPAGRQAGRAPGAEPACVVMVDLSGADRLGMESDVAVDHALPVRRRRGGLLSQPDAHAVGLAAGG